jgi:hypothetical protein
MRLAYSAVILTAALVFVGAGCGTAPTATAPNAKPAVQTQPAPSADISPAPASKIVAESPDGNFVLRGTGDCATGTYSIGAGEKASDERGAFAMYNLGFNETGVAPESDDAGAVYVQRNADRQGEWPETTEAKKSFEDGGTTVYQWLTNLGDVSTKCKLIVTKE